ncbi:hypothetical protein ROZALSC1DRAFT_28428 [Rozella allomycis CSF55]|uniref:Chloride channel protein n=1 Tax=Rozella allomycis (strain CSF55) TaxID=988480 RepID=A0A4V1J021_ROZAC|nr:hypothetical protein ROZALSC1DRAFT_28428 [Rozella allomycis CSF55]
MQLEHSSQQTLLPLRYGASSPVNNPPNCQLFWWRRWRKDDEEQEDIEWKKEGTGKRAAYDDYSTIDWIHDFAKERIRLRKLKELAKKDGLKGVLILAFDASQAWLITFLIGLFVGVISAFLTLAIEWLVGMRHGYCSDAFYLSKRFCCWQISDEECSKWHNFSEYYILQYLVYTLFSVAFAIIGSWFVISFAPYAAGSGIAEVKTILGGFIIRKFLASGLSLGKEGPSVHIACCCGNIILRLFKKYSTNEGKKREILSAASACGIAVAFGSPISGVLYSLEEVSYYFPTKTMLRSFFCSMIAVIVFQMIDPFRSGKLVMFQSKYDYSWKSFQIVIFLLIGVICGALGSLLVKLNVRWHKYRKTNFLLQKNPLIEIGMVAIITALINFPNAFMRIDAPELLSILFSECKASDGMEICNESMVLKTSMLLLWTIIVKMALTSFTYGIKIPAGIFVPSLAIGACVGRLVGIVFQQIQELNPTFFLFRSCTDGEVCIVPGAYALIGAASFLTGVTRMTVVMYEITGALTYILPIIIAVMVSKFVSDFLQPDPMYPTRLFISRVDCFIALKEYPFLNIDKEYPYSHPVSNAMTHVCNLALFDVSRSTVEYTERLLSETTYKGFPIVKNMNELLIIGYINRTELRYAVTRQNPLIHDASMFVTSEEKCDCNELNLNPWINHAPLCVTERTSMDMCIDLFKKMGIRYLLIVKDGQLQGIITKKDIIRYLSSDIPSPSNLDRVLIDFFSKPTISPHTNILDAILTEENIRLGKVTNVGFNVALIQIKMRHKTFADSTINGLVSILLENEVAKSHFTVLEETRGIIEKGQFSHKLARALARRNEDTRAGSESSATNAIDLVHSDYGQRSLHENSPGYLSIYMKSVKSNRKLKSMIEKFNQCDKKRPPTYDESLMSPPRYEDIFTHQ